MDLEKLIADLEAHDLKIDAILKAPAGPNGQLTAEQQTEHDKLVAERKPKVEAISREQERMAREEERATLKAKAAAAKEKQSRRAVPGSQRLTDPDQPKSSDVPAERIEAAAVSIIPAGVKRFGKLKNFKGTRDTVAGRFTAEERAYRFGMWALALLSIQIPGRYRSKRAEEWLGKNMSAVTGTDPSGTHYLIPEEFGADIIDLREYFGVARRLLKMVPMTSDTRTDPRRKGGLTASFVSEGGAGTESQKVWDNVRLTAKEIMVLSRYTANVNADVVINLGDDLAGEIAYAFTKLEDSCAFSLGDGTSTYGGIVGITQKLLGVTNNAGIWTAPGSGWAGITLADFNMVPGLLPQYADVLGEVSWVCHKAFYFGIMQKLELAAGGVTALEVAEGDRRPRPLFLGYPVDFSQIMPSTTGSAQIPCYLGNYALGASFGDRQQDSIAFSEHATINGENVFERNQIAIRGIERIDINVHDVGDSTLPGPIVALKTT